MRARIIYLLLFPLFLLAWFPKNHEIMLLPVQDGQIDYVSWKDCKKRADGYCNVYDHKLRLSKSGLFREGKFLTGKLFIYDCLDSLGRILLYKNGLLTGEDSSFVYRKRIKKRYENRILVSDGTYKNGYLWDGKHYVYDKNGLLIKIEIYRNGLYFADGQLNDPGFQDNRFIQKKFQTDQKKYFLCDTITVHWPYRDSINLHSDGYFGPAITFVKKTRGTFIGDTTSQVKVALGPGNYVFRFGEVIRVHHLFKPGTRGIFKIGFFNHSDGQLIYTNEFAVE